VGKTNLVIFLGVDRLSRFIASTFGVSGLFVRSYYWPQQWGWADNILMRWLSGAFFVLDVLYGVCFWYTRQAEQQAELKQKQG
jgi:paspaline synthase